MSVNYYMTTTDAEFVFHHMEGASINYFDKRFELHLAQIVAGLKPLFQVTAEYSHWSELSTYINKHEKQTIIYDEHGCSHSSEEFINKMTEYNCKLKVD